VRILIVEDERKVARFIRQGLVEEDTPSTSLPTVAPRSITSSTTDSTSWCST